MTAQREETGRKGAMIYECWYGFPCKFAENDCEKYNAAETAEESECIRCGCLGFTGSRSQAEETYGSCGRCSSKCGYRHSFFFTAE